MIGDHVLNGVDDLQGVDRTVDLGNRSSGALFQVPAGPMSVTARVLIRDE